MSESQSSAVLGTALPDPPIFSRALLIGLIGAAVGVAAGIAACRIAIGIPSADAYDNIAKTVELCLIATGLLSIVYFAEQARIERERDRRAAEQERARSASERTEREKHRLWARVDAYYRYFRALPNQECHNKYCLAATTELHFNVDQLDGKGSALTPEQLGMIKKNPMLDRVCRDYLDEFEMFAAGVRAHFIDDEIAYSIEGGRLCRIVTTFKPLIDKAQKQNPKAYCELEELFTVWAPRRAKELRPKALASNHVDGT